MARSKVQRDQHARAKGLKEAKRSKVRKQRMLRSRAKALHDAKKPSNS